MVCSNCGRVVLNGEEVVTVHDMICCLSCSIDMLIERVDMLERRIEELEANAGIAVRV